MFCTVYVVTLHWTLASVYLLVRRKTESEQKREKEREIAKGCERFAPGGTT